MKITAEPRSDQWNADDFVGGPRTFTIAGVKVGTAEQKYDIELVEGDGRSWRPPLTMLRLLIAAWGDDAAVWTGRRVTLYRDESVRFGSDAVGGIRISHLSHLPGNKPLTTMLTSTRGRRARHVVEPLPDAAVATASEPATEGALSESARKKWFNSMLDIFGEANAIEPPEKLTVVKSITGDADLLEPLELTDVELRKVVTTLGEWKKDGTLVDKVAEVLDMAAIQAESEGGESK